MNLADLFPDEDHRFRLGLEPGDLAEFFRTRDATGNVLAERQRWLASAPARHAQLQPEGAPLLADFATLVAARGQAGEVAGIPSVVELGRRLEPDFLLLSPDAAGEFRLRGGALCFPTGWALEEKLGQPLDLIHGVVPGLNRVLGPAIGRLLARLKGGEAWQRSNWGLAATPELNLHPALGRPAPSLPVDLTGLWLRVEQQALAALPRTGGVVFGIRVVVVRLDRAVVEPGVATSLARALASMSEPVAAYKRLAPIRAPLISLLRRLP